MSPSPSTAVPLVMTATMFCRAVYSAAVDGSRAISSHGAATPGEYASDRSDCDARLRVAGTFTRSLCSST